MSLKIEEGGLTASLLPWGAALQSLYLDGYPFSLVLGFKQPELYPQHSPNFGATVGRYANRIRDGRFDLDGKSYQVDQNENQQHCLHGGSAGLGKRDWQVAAYCSNSVRFEILDEDDHMGFPGNCDISCTYTLPGDGVLEIKLEARSDQTTLCNLAHHSYFNLDGGNDILDHKLQIFADRYLPVDDVLIPTGDVRAVAGSEFDFRVERAIGEKVSVYDHNYCLSAAGFSMSANKDLKPKLAAKVHGARSGVHVEVSTTEPGMQFYSGTGVDTPIAGLNGACYGPHAGFCLEPQRWPDSPHHAHFPQAVLRQDEIYRQHSIFRFHRDDA